MNAPPRVVRVLLWRHGRTAYNHTNRWQGQLDADLDEVGREQAARAAEVLAKQVAGVPVHLVASDLRRAADTAAALAALVGVEPVLDRRLREIDAGAWEGLTRAEIVAAGMGDELDAWARGEDVRIGRTGERRSEVGLRGAQAVAEHVRAVPEGGTLVVAAHGGLLRGAVLTLLGLDPAAWHVLGGLGNCAWAELSVHVDAAADGAPVDGSWRLIRYNVSSIDY